MSNSLQPLGLQYSCLENPMDVGAWWAAVHGVAKSRTWLRDFTFTFLFHALEKETATHSSILAWRIPGTGEPWAAVCRVAQSWTRLKWLSIGLQHTWSLSITNSRKLISCPLSWWCHPTISSSVVPFSSCFQSFPVSGTFLMSHFFTSGGQSIGASASASVPPMNI